MRVFFIARTFNSLFFFVTIFIVLALGTRVRTDDTVISGFILVLLYVRGPIEQIVAAMPLFGGRRRHSEKLPNSPPL
jgi:putative ATP-binding cassette transporter